MKEGQIAICQMAAAAGATSTSTVPVKWAQRKDKLFVTVDVVSATNVAVNFGENTITVSGTPAAAGSLPFSSHLVLSHAIDPSGSTYKVLGPCIQIAAKKATSGPHWDKLLDAKKVKWLSCDWALWKDEEDDKGNDPAVNFGGYGDMGNMMNFDGLGGPTGGDEDSDDEAPAEGADDAANAADLKDLDN